MMKNADLGKEWNREMRWKSLTMFEEGRKAIVKIVLDMWFKEFKDEKEIANILDIPENHIHNIIVANRYCMWI